MIFPVASCFHTGSEAHPASCTMGTGGPFPGLKRCWGVTLTIHPHLMPRSRMSRSCTPLPPSAFVACSGAALAFLGLEDVIERRGRVVNTPSYSGHRLS
jgi:hypothetical protein